MSAHAELAPGVPDDYYRRIFEAEREHFWYRGMWAIAAGLLGNRMRADGRLLDAGCGTGGFLRFALEHGRFAGVAGTDIAGAAIELARERVPEADLAVAALRELPFPDGAFEVVVSNDVLQHVPEGEVQESLRELRRVLAQDGVLLLRTNGSRRLRRERDDWRAYDAATLRHELGAAGFAVERLTHANALLSVWAAVRGRSPHAPSEERHGIPVERPHALKSAVGRRVLRAEARYLARPGRSLPVGHTIFAVAS